MDRTPPATSGALRYVWRGIRNHGGARQWQSVVCSGLLKNLVRRRRDSVSFRYPNPFVADALSKGGIVRNPQGRPVSEMRAVQPHHYRMRRCGFTSCTNRNSFHFE